MMPGMRPILLDSRAAAGCAHRVALDHDPTLHADKAPPTLVEQRRMEEGRDFENDVVATLRARLGRKMVDLRDIRDPDETLDAMDRRVTVIVGGQLPDDHAGGRTGIPDLLIHVGDGKYLPGDIKWHRVAAPAGKRPKQALVSLPAAPGDIYSELSLKPLGKTLWPDLAQLAHYTRMLQATGHHPGDRLLAALIGRPLADGEDHILVWYDLAESLGVNTEPVDNPEASIIDAYDARHALRVDIAAGRATSQPARSSLCDTCRWLAVCTDRAGDDASWALRRDAIKPRDWDALRRAGIVTVADLARVDATDPRWVSAFVPYSSATSPSKALEMLDDAAQRAEMITTGQTLRRTTTGPIDVPVADVEVDIDLEWDVDNHVYLWAGTVRRGPTRVEGEQGPYVHFSHFGPMTRAVERELAEAFTDWLDRVIAKAESRGHSITVFHYAHPERTNLARVLGPDADTYLEHFVDLYDVVRENFTGAWGLSIKQVAPHFGFQWRDDDPGGLQSQDWLLMAQETTEPRVREELARRILAYNEDDVRAQAAIRDGMRAAHGKGSARRLQVVS